MNVTAKAPDGATLFQELVLNVLNLVFAFNATAASTQVELDTNLAMKYPTPFLPKVRAVVR